MSYISFNTLIISKDIGDDRFNWNDFDYIMVRTVNEVISVTIDEIPKIRLNIDIVNIIDDYKFLIDPNDVYRIFRYNEEFFNVKLNVNYPKSYFIGFGNNNESGIFKFYSSPDLNRIKWFVDYESVRDLISNDYINKSKLPPSFSKFIKDQELVYSFKPYLRRLYMSNSDYSVENGNIYIVDTDNIFIVDKVKLSDYDNKSVIDGKTYII